MYYLANNYTRDTAIMVVGCGGTGGFVAEGLCRILPRENELVLIDHDRVEERNLVRQNFTAADLGSFKSEALAKRLSQAYKRPLGYSVEPVGFGNRDKLLLAHLVIGCVDNGLVRRDIARSLTRSELSPWWIDAGNGENYGQVIIGNCRGSCEDAFEPAKELCHYLPLPTIQRPELLLQKPVEHSCADDVTTGDQSPVINQAMAAMVLEVVRRLLAGTCPWMQLYIDLDSGSLTPVFATPEAVRKITKLSVNKLERR